MSTNLSYLKSSSNGFFKYRRRTPKPLQEYINSEVVVKSLGNNEVEAITKAICLNNLINEAIELTKIKSVPRETIIKTLSTEIELTSIKKVYNPKTLSHFSLIYLEQSNVTTIEYSFREYFFKSFLPLIIEVMFNEQDMELELLTYEKLLKIRNLFLKLPNKNYRKYKVMNQKELMLKIIKGSLVVPQEYLLSEGTVNKHVKRIKSLLLFVKEMGMYSHYISNNLTIKSKKETSTRGLRAVMSTDEIDTVFNNFDENIRYIYEVLLYSGMRRSELYKCNIIEIEGIKCFNLKSISARLKTSSSYRLIPIHHKLFYMIDKYGDIINTLSPDRLTRGFTKAIRKSLEDVQGKSLYSLRHTFATTLVAKEVQPEIVSELLGHAHSTMTMNRYVKGYPIQILKKAIDKLEFKTSRTVKT
jgi:integrase